MPSSGKRLALVGFSPKGEARARALVDGLGADRLSVFIWDKDASTNAPGADAVIIAAPLCTETISRARRSHPSAPIIAVGESLSQSEAVGTIRAGADDYVCLASGDAELLARLRHHLDCPVPNAGGLARGDDFAGVSPAVANIKALVAKLGRSNSTTLIRGETGTGKELVAMMLHRNGPRRAGPLVPINCAAIPETLIEGELFGYEKGAFSGASRDYPGKFRLAHGGTLFLDEIGELSLAAQAKILRALESGEVFPIGSSRPCRVDVRVLAATHRDLRAETETGAFRADLFYRLAVIQLTIPPLRDRREDILPIAEVLLDAMSADQNRAAPTLSPCAREALRAHDWPGNVREMRNALEHALVMAEFDDRIAATDLPEAIGATVLHAATAQAAGSPSRDSLIRALVNAGGSKAKAARALNCSRMTLYRRMEREGIGDTDFPAAW